MDDLNPDHHEFVPSESGGRELIVCFLNKLKSGEYEGREALSAATQNLLIVNSHRLPWRGAKLDDLLNMMPVMQAEVAAFLEVFKPSKLYFFGFSLSGFPAIYMGAAFAADRIFVLSPDLVIGEPGTRSAFHLRHQQTTFPDPDLKDYLQRFTLKDLTILVGEQDSGDTYYASRLRAMPGVRVHVLKRVTHQVFAYLRVKRAVMPLLLAEDTIAVARQLRIKFSKILDTQAPRLWFLGRRELQLKDYAGAERSLREVAKLMPDNKYAASDLVDALRHQAKYDEALEITAGIISKFPEGSRVHHIQARLKVLAKRQKRSRKRQARSEQANNQPIEASAATGARLTSA